MLLRVFILSFGWVLIGGLSAQSAHSSLRQGDRAYTDRDFQQAEQHYRRALEQQNTPQGNHNLGNALFEQGDYEEAARRYEEAATLSDDAEDKARALHNLGNARLAQKDYDSAIEAYKGSLRANPHDKETKLNLSLALDQKNQQEQEQGEGQSDQSSPDSQQGQAGSESTADSPQDGQASTAEPVQGRISESEAEQLLDRIGDAETQTRRNVTEGDMNSCSSDRKW